MGEAWFELYSSLSCRASSCLRQTQEKGIAVHAAAVKVDISFRFHGIEPSKKSKEKIQRKVRDEMAARKAATSEQPAGTLNQLKHAQVSPS